MTLNNEIESWKNEFGMEFPSWLTEDVDEFLTRYGKSIAEKTVEAVRVNVNPNGCGMTCNQCDYDSGWEEWCDCLCHQAVTEQSKKAKEWLGE